MGGGSCVEVSGEVEVVLKSAQISTHPAQPSPVVCFFCGEDTDGKAAAQGGSTLKWT